MTRPMNTPDFIRILRKRGKSEAFVRSVVYDNPLRFFSQSKGYNFIPPVSVASSEAEGSDAARDHEAAAR